MPHVWFKSFGVSSICPSQGETVALLQTTLYLILYISRFALVPITGANTLQTAVCAACWKENRRGFLLLQSQG